MNRHRETLVLVSWLGVLAILAAACGPGGGETTTTGGTPVTGGTVQIGYAGAPEDLNPGIGVLAEDYIMYNLIYDSLLDIDLDGNYLPEVATSWTPSDDGLTWTLTIRDDITFHDGEPLTVDDVVYSMTLFRDTEDFFLLGDYLAPWVDDPETPEVPEITAIDATTIRMTSEYLVAAFEYRMPGMYILPQHIWEAVDDVATFTNDEMIGSGPFVLAEYSQGEFVRLESNTDYWEGAPDVDEIIFQTVDNPDARVQALINGELDAITVFPATAIPALRDAANVEVVDGLDFGGRFADIIFNMIDPADCPPDDGVCSGHPALRDVQVRRALAHAVDKQQLIDSLLLGLGEPGLGLVPPALGDWFAEELVPNDYAFDLEAAAAMLEEAGYVDTDGDGIRECPTADCGPTGDLTFRLNYPTDNEEHPRVSDTLSGWWEDIGVALQIQGLDEDALIAICCPTFDFDVILWSWSSDPDPEGLLSVLACDSIPTGFSETGYCNPAYDELYNQQTVETDRAARREIIVEMQRMTLEDVPYIIPWYYPKIQAYRTDTFTGWLVDSRIIALEDASSLTVIQAAG